MDGLDTLTLLVTAAFAAVGLGLLLPRRKREAPGAKSDTGRQRRKRGLAA